MDLLKSLKLSNWANHAMQMKQGNLKSKVPRIKKMVEFAKSLHEFMYIHTLRGGIN